MSIPKPEYYTIVNGLVVNFFDLSINLPVSWLWNFGDATTSTSQNPTKTYSAAGNYNVSLTATNADGSQNIVKMVFVSVVPTELGIGIDEFVKMNLPGGLTLLPNIIPSLKKKWQLILFDAVPTAETPSSMYDESTWPDSWNLLIAYCIVYDILMILSQEAFLGSLQLDSSSNNGNNNSNSSSGGLKRLVEGPAEAEWFDLSNQLSNMFKVGADGTSPFTQLSQQACLMASKLRVRLPFCPLIKNPMLFVISDNPYKC